MRATSNSSRLATSGSARSARRLFFSSDGLAQIARSLAEARKGAQSPREIGDVRARGAPRLDEASQQLLRERTFAESRGDLHALAHGLWRRSPASSLRNRRASTSVRSCPGRRPTISYSSRIFA